MTLVDWLFVAKEVGKYLLEPCVLPRGNGVFALLEYTQNKRHRKIYRPQPIILNDAAEQPMEAGGLTALTQAHFNEAMKIVAQR